MLVRNAVFHVDSVFNPLGSFVGVTRARPAGHKKARHHKKPAAHRVRAHKKARHHKKRHHRK
jgi:hypothetical protein